MSKLGNKKKGGFFSRMHQKRRFPAHLCTICCCCGLLKWDGYVTKHYLLWYCLKSCLKKALFSQPQFAAGAAHHTRHATVRARLTTRQAMRDRKAAAWRAAAGKARRGANPANPRVIADIGANDAVSFSGLHEGSSCSSSGMEALADKPLFVVARGRIPEELHAELCREHSEAELARINRRVHRTLAPSSQPWAQPKALWIFGPSAVGKSTLSDASALELFESPENAVEIDGAHFRDEHAGWLAVTQHGYAGGILHEDAWSLFKKHSKSTQLKARILKEAIDARQHLIIPDTMNAPDKVDKLLQLLLDAGYALHAMCLWAPLKATRQRGEPRSIREGKLWSPDEYAVSTRGTLAMARRFATGTREQPAAFKSVTMWDNTIFPASQCSLDEFARLCCLDNDAAEMHLERVRTNAMRRARRCSTGAESGHAPRRLQRSILSVFDRTNTSERCGSQMAASRHLQQPQHQHHPQPQHQQRPAEGLTGAPSPPAICIGPNTPHAVTQCATFGGMCSAVGSHVVASCGSAQSATVLQSAEVALDVGPSAPLPLPGAQHASRRRRATDFCAGALVGLSVGLLGVALPIGIRLGSCSR